MRSCLSALTVDFSRISDFPVFYVVLLKTAYLTFALSMKTCNAKISKMCTPRSREFELSVIEYYPYDEHGTFQTRPRIFYSGQYQRITSVISCAVPSADSIMYHSDISHESVFSTKLFD